MSLSKLLATLAAELVSAQLKSSPLEGEIAAQHTLVTIVINADGAYGLAAGRCDGGEVDFIMLLRVLEAARQTMVGGTVN